MSRGPIALVGALPRTVRLLVAGTFVNRLGSFILPFLTLVLHREFGLSEARTGLLVGAYGAGSIVSMLSGGVLTDRLGRRRTLLLSLFPVHASLPEWAFWALLGIVVLPSAPMMLALDRADHPERLRGRATV